jgi:hypothetical protein
MLATAHEAPPALVRRIDGLGHVAGFRLRQTLAQAIRHFGKPARELFTPADCHVTWPALHLSADFAPGRSPGDPPGSRRCSRAGQASRFYAGLSWSTAAGLRVGDPVPSIAARYPGLQPPSVPPGGVSYYFLYPRHPSLFRGTQLIAEVAKGRVDAIIVGTSFTFTTG